LTIVFNGTLSDRRCRLYAIEEFAYGLCLGGRGDHRGPVLGNGFVPAVRDEVEINLSRAGGGSGSIRCTQSYGFTPAQMLETRRVSPASSQPRAMTFWTRNK
jgi:hypothetical protein